MQSTYVAYTGSSMHPLFQPGDLLEVLPYSGRIVDRGDVIVFYCPCEERTIVHRVATIGRQGIRTRGDNNARLDPWLVSPELIVGYVAGVLRGLRWRLVARGRSGRLVSDAMRAIRHLRTAIFTRMHPLCIWVAGARYVRTVRKQLAAPRIVACRHLEGTERHLLVGRRVIGVLPAGRSRWIIRWPFRWLVNEPSLLI